MQGTFGVVKKMLTDGGFVKLSGIGGLARAGKALTDVEFSDKIISFAARQRYSTIHVAPVA